MISVFPWVKGTMSIIVIKKGMNNWKLVLWMILAPLVLMGQNVDFKASNFKEKKEELMLMKILTFL